MQIGFDLQPLEYSFTQNLYCLLMYLFIVLTNYNSNICGYKTWNIKRADKTVFIVLLFFIYSLTNYVDHDYWGYYGGVKFGSLGPNAHFEEAYLGIIRYFERNYLAFRAVVWGGALALFCVGAKAAKLSVYHSVWALAACFLVTFCYGRVSLAMAFVFTGYVLFYQNKKRNIPMAVLGAGLFACSFFFHKSIVFAMFMSVVMTFVPINKKSIWLIILALPVFIILARMGFAYILETGVGLNEDTANAVVSYSESERQQSNFLGKIRSIIEYGRFYFPAIVCARALFVKHRENFAPKLTLNLFKIALGLILCGTCFFFFDLNNTVFAYRILFMSMIPLIYCLVDFYGKGVISLKQYKCCIWWGMSGSLYNLLYSVYSQL